MIEEVYRRIAAQRDNPDITAFGGWRAYGENR